MLLLNLLVFFFSQAEPVGAVMGDQPLLQPFPREPLLNEIIAFEPLAGHKFNLEAKNSCGNGRLLEKDEHKLQCQMYAPGTSELQLYICDDRKTFCRREVLKLTTQSPKGVVGWLKYYKNSTIDTEKWSTPYRSGESAQPPARGFIGNDLDKALFEAKKQKKNILVYFSQLSCVPCRMMKELTLASDEFQNLTNHFIRVQIDIDVDTHPELIKPLNIKGTPTFMALTRDFKELDRRMIVMSTGTVKDWLASLPKKPLEKKPEEPPPQTQAPVASDDVFKFLNYNDYILNKSIETITAKDKMSFEKSLAPVAAFENQLNGKLEHVDSLQKDLMVYDIYSVMKYGYEKTGQPAEAKKMGQKLAALIDQLTRLPGVGKTPYLEFVKADVASDAVTKQKLVSELQNENKNDYSFDFSEAYHLYEAKNYDKALEHVEKSLVIAKDRSWQKAFLLKMDILKELNRQKDALQMIDDLLTKTQLPMSSGMKVHTFIQSLRKKQLLLAKES